MMPARTITLALVALLAAACSRSVEATWPETGAARYHGSVSSVDGEWRAQGEWRFWYSNGIQQAEGDFGDGVLVSADDLGAESTRIPREGRTLWWTFWDEQGRMLAEGQFEHGLRSNLWVCWYENGRQCCTGHFEADLPHGYHVTWYPAGTKREERWYDEGFLDGRRRIWNEAGAEVWTGDYRQGELVASTPAGLAEPPVHEVGGCAERAEHGLARSVDVASRAR